MKIILIAIAFATGGALLFGALFLQSGSASDDGPVATESAPVDPPYLPAGKLLVIGDSISLGYGILGDGPGCKGTPETHDPSLSFAALLAGKLDRELVLKAESGRGLVRNYDGFDAPTLADITLPDGALSPAIEQESLGLIVIHIGTNDFFQHDPEPGFSDRYIDILQALQAHAPDAKILSVAGPMLHGEDAARFHGALDTAVNAFNAETDNDADILVFTETVKDEAAWGCDWHPSASSQAFMADQIMARLLQF